jgi:hypothetical protein
VAAPGLAQLSLTLQLRVALPSPGADPSPIVFPWQGRALRQMAAISHHREKLGAPTMMEIITQPGWDEKVRESL